MFVVFLNKDLLYILNKAFLGLKSLLGLKAYILGRPWLQVLCFQIKKIRSKKLNLLSKLNWFVNKDLILFYIFQCTSLYYAEARSDLN